MSDPVRPIAAIVSLTLALLILDWFFVGLTIPGDPILERIARALGSTLILTINLGEDDAPGF